jgi:membrane peptidoglycan carboxypeptidase
LFCSAKCPRGVHPPAWLLKERRRVLDPAHAYEMTNVLSDNNARCTVQVCEFGLNSPLELNRPAAAKTGTTNDWTDNWTVGYVPQMVTGVWTGNADRSPMLNVIGITGAAPIWQTYMEGAFKILKLPVENFVQPPNVVVSGLCTNPGTYGGPGTTSSTVEDIEVGSATSTNYPLCSLPEKGTMPVACAQYPANPLPAGFECPSGAYYYSTTPGPYGITPEPYGTVPGQTYYNGTQTGSGTQPGYVEPPATVSPPPAPAPPVVVPTLPVAQPTQVPALPPIIQP